MNWGIIGFGKHTERTLVPAFKDCKNSSLIAIATSCPDKCFALKKKFKNLNIFNNYLDLINHDSIDAVLISTANILHPDLCVKSLISGKHVLCEKPLAWETSKIHEIKKTLSKSGKLLSTGFMYRTHPQMSFLRKELEDNEPIEITANFQYPSIRSKNIRNNYELGGGALLDIGCYLLDVWKFFGKEEDYTHQFYSKRSQDTKCDESGLIILNSNKTRGIFSYSQSMPRYQELKIWTKSCGYIIESPFLVPRNKHVIITKIDEQGSKKNIKIPPSNTYQIEIDLFSESIKKGALIEPLTSGIENAEDLSKFIH